VSASKTQRRAAGRACCCCCWSRAGTLRHHWCHRAQLHQVALPPAAAGRARLWQQLQLLQGRLLLLAVGAASPLYCW
jgi:hypothetical protein